MAQYSIMLRSRILGCPTEVRVLIPDVPFEQSQDPKEYYLNPGKKRVLWLLHGANASPTEWIGNTNIARYAHDRDVIVVMPTALSGDYCNYTTFSHGFNFWKYFTEELMPFIYGWFPASQKREDNFIAGFSMGGTGAMMFGFAYPEKFGGIAVLSSAVRNIDTLRAYRSMTSAEFRVEGKDPVRFPGTYGGWNFKEINMIAKYPTVGDFLDSPENTWDRYIEAWKGGNLPPMYVTVGSNDRCSARVAEFQALAKELGDTQTIFEVVDGYDHEYAFWDLAVLKALDFFGIEPRSNTRDSL